MRATFRVVDADTHVDECEATWHSLAGGVNAKFAPFNVSRDVPTNAPAGPNPEQSRWWSVGGRLQPRVFRDEIHHPARVSRELDDVAVRLADMDRMGVDVQVIFPTFFIRYGATSAEAEQAVVGAYNRWLAERCAESNGRLRWVAVLPYMDQRMAVQELRRAKEHGACAVFKRGYDLEKPVSDPHFFPVYEEANALDMPICVHTGHPLPGREWDRGFPVISAFTSIVTSRLPDKYPELRWGFVEAGASWIPYALAQMATQARAETLRDRARTFNVAQDLFRADRLFVTIDPVDDVEHLLKFGTEDNLMVGTDYTHGDPSANQAALQEVRAWVGEGKIGETVAHKILDTNARKFYGLPG
jgi:predicted TIM-barrel fold metal-dependent hydrolase